MLDTSLAAVTAVVAACGSFTALELAVRLSTSRRSLALHCKTLCGALALGVGLWCVTLLGLLSVSIPPWPTSHGPALFVSLAVAILGQALALAMLAGRQPDLSRILVSATASAAAICATYVTCFVTLGGQPVSNRLLGTLATACALGVAAGTAALWLRYSIGTRRSPWVGAVKCLAVLLGAAAILGIQALMLAKGQVAFSAPAAVAVAQIIAVALAATGLGALAVTHAITVYDGRLALRTGQCARELEEVHTRLQYLATHDSLTGLPNWLLFKERLAQAVADTDRPGRAIAVAVLDLDRFSSLNHSLGHGAGDWLLTEVALRVGAVLRPGDLLARLGSDEFVVLIDSVAARVDAECITAAVLAALTVPIGVNGADVHVRPSIGVSIWPDDGRRVDDLLTHAEVAMAVAKKRGGNETQFFERGMTDSMHERLVLENDLRRALSAGEFELAFQPVLSTKTGRIVTAEALVRWRHPLRGLIGPNSFIPLAEETGLMIPLGEWVVREVCRQASAWQLERGIPIRLAVNLSATQFRHQNLLEVIRSALAAENLDARYLEVELTETSVMTNPEESAGVLRQLRKMGVTVAVDDFGTGYSSLSYLRRFPIDKLKIDRSFVRDLATSRTDESIVRAIIVLAHSVGLEVIAEGVETAEQLRCVSVLGCDQWQGFYCCEPQSAARFGQMLQERTGGTRTGLVAALTR
jgi:diguanylate cyclase (GGDEF)-like protein